MDEKDVFIEPLYQEEDKYAAFDVQGLEKDSDVSSYAQSESELDLNSEDRHQRHI